jgi:hypothetical protein
LRIEKPLFCTTLRRFSDIGLALALNGAYHSYIDNTYM